MRKRIYALALTIVVIALLAVGFWAYRAGKFAGLADIIKSSPAPAQVEINVKDNLGNNLPSVDIQMSLDNQTYNSVGQTDTSGNFTYNTYQTDGVVLYFIALKPMYSSAGSQKITVNHSIATQNLNFILTQITIPTGKGAIMGKVTSGGQRLFQAQVSLYTTSNVATGNNAWTKDDGTYLLNGLDPGAYNIAASKDGYSEDRKTNQTVKADQVTTIDFSLSSTASPSPSSSSTLNPSPSPSTPPDKTKFIYMAEVVDSVSGNLIKDVSVIITASPAIPGFNSWTGTTKDSPVDVDKYGPAINLVALHLPAPPDGYYNCTQNYTATFKNDLYQDQTQTFLCSDIKLDTKLNSYVYKSDKLEMQSKTPRFFLHGQITDKTNGQLIAGAKVKIDEYQFIGSRKLIAQYEQSSDQNGNYQFLINLPLTKNGEAAYIHEYQMQISKEGYQDENLVIKSNIVADEDDNLTRDFSLFPNSRFGYLYGKVSDLDSGRPISGAVITLARNGRMLYAKSATTIFDGTYKINGLPAGDYEIYIYHSDYYDNSLSEKKKQVHIGIGTKLDFQLKQIQERRLYNLNVKIFDNQGKRIRIEDLEVVDELILFVMNPLQANQQGIEGAVVWPQFVYQENDPDATARFTGLPSNIPLLLNVQILKTFSKNNEMYTFSPVFKQFSYDCKTETNKDCEYDLDVKLDRIERDPDKYDLLITSSFDYKCPPAEVPSEQEECEEKCRLAFSFANDPSLGQVKVKLQSKENPENTKEGHLDQQGRLYIGNILPGKYKIEVDSNCYEAKKDSEVEVTGKEAPQPDVYQLILQIKPECKDKKIKITTVNGIEIRFFGPLAQTYVDKGIWNLLTTRLIRLNNSLNENNRRLANPPPINVVDSSFFNAALGNDCFLEDFSGYAIIITTEFLSRQNPDNLLLMISHEYGHYVEAKIFDSGPDTHDKNYLNWRNTFDAASSSQDKVRIFDLITDANISQSFGPEGHPFQSEQEFFASFFNAYYNHNQRLLRLIKKLPHDSEARYILEFAWQMFAEKVGKLHSNDDSLWGGTIGDKIWSPRAIKRGWWRHDRGRSATMLENIESQIWPYISNSYYSLHIDENLSRIEINYSRFMSFWQGLIKRNDQGSFSGMVISADIHSRAGYQARSNLLIVVGGRVATTDSKGRFILDKINQGKQQIKVFDKKNMHELNCELKEVEIKKDTKIDKIIVVN